MKKPFPTIPSKSSSSSFYYSSSSCAGFKSTMLLVLVLILASFDHNLLCSAYNRPPARETLSIPFSSNSDDPTPEQVHISMVGANQMRVTWITAGETPAIVTYGTSPGVYNSSATGTTYKYSYVLYTSGVIHDVVIGPLQPRTVYYYRCSSVSKDYSFRTPPAQLPLHFVVAGDLGQTGWTKTTLEHISGWDYDVLLLPGDLSYADFYQPHWDSFGRLVEGLASQRAWMVTQGNHEIEKIPIIASTPFKAYNARWRMPYELSGSNSNLFYSFDVAAGAVHVLMLGSYTDFDSGSDQYKWVVADLAKVNRKKTPWLVAVIHAPWYSTNTAHQGEGEDMRKTMEGLLYKARVDVVFAGHVHAYERFDRVFDNKVDSCGPVYITIGDGGNREGLARSYVDPKPEISLFREASFGHGRFQVVNETHANWSWQRNDDSVSTVADSTWLLSLSSTKPCMPNS